jgi:hypothetical protein
LKGFKTFRDLNELGRQSLRRHVGLAENVQRGLNLTLVQVEVLLQTSNQLLVRLEGVAFHVLSSAEATLGAGFDLERIGLRAVRGRAPSL